MDRTGLDDGILTVDLGEGRVSISQDVATLARWRVYGAASLTKPLIALEIRKLIDRGEIRLDQPIAELLPDMATQPSRSRGVTVRRLLQHTAGFDQHASGDPMFRTSLPLACRAAAKTVLSRPLDFPPGSRLEYSNSGYCLLGELLLRHREGIGRPLLETIETAQWGAAGGWRSTLPELYAALRQTLPIRDLAPERSMEDGSYYGYAWRHWPGEHDGPPWTHFGRLPGMVAVAISDGRNHLLVAHFEGDPVDYNPVAEQFSRDAWKCLPGWNAPAGPARTASAPSLKGG